MVLPTNSETPGQTFAASMPPAGGSFLTVTADNLAVASHTGTEVLPIRSAALLFVYADGQRTLIGVTVNFGRP